MIIREKELNGLHILSLSGKLDFFSKNAFREAISKHKELGTKGLILDLKGISFMDSTGLGSIARAAKIFQEVKGKMIVVNPQEQIKSLLSQTSFSSIVPMFTTDEDYSQFSEITL